MKIWAYTCVKNETRHVRRWADACKDFDGMLWLDTGSTDNTVDAAQQAGITVHESWLDPFRFDTARNTALALIPPTVTHCLQVDADEIVEPGWRDELEANPDHTRYSYSMVSGTTSGWGKVTRTNLHARHGHRWKHPIHEALDGPKATCHLSALTLTHKPDGTKSRKHYIDMMVRAVQDEPHNPRMRFYLGREHMTRGQWEQARTHLTDYLAMDGGWDTERGEAYRYIAQMDYDPERWLWKAIAENPHRREPYVDLCRFYLKKNRRQRAAAMYRLAETRNDDTLYTTDGLAWGASFDNLGKRALA